MHGQRIHPRHPPSSHSSPALLLRLPGCLALLQALLSKPLSLLRLVDLLKFWLASRMAATERAKARAWQEQTLKYGTLVPDDTIAILLGLVFCIICPLIAPVALAYFCVASLVWKYQVLYVYQQEYQSGGKASEAVQALLCVVQRGGVGWGLGMGSLSCCCSWMPAALPGQVHWFLSCRVLRTA